LSVRREGVESGENPKGEIVVQTEPGGDALEESSIRSRSGQLMVHGARSSERCENNDCWFNRWPAGKG